MSVLLQLSDPHFGTEQAPMVKALAALAQQQQPDLLVLSGDITQRAKRNQFAVARAFTDRLGAPLLAILGNHDIPLFDLGQRLFHPYARYREAFDNELEPIHASRDLLVQCVNTTRWYRHKGGMESSAQIERVAIRLRRRARSTAGGGAPTHWRAARHRATQPAAWPRPGTAKLGCSWLRCGVGCSTRSMTALWNSVGNSVSIT